MSQPDTASAGATPRNHVLTLDRLSRSFGPVCALADVSLTLRAGEVHALMGENGAGKSTLIRLLAGLDSPDAGQIMLDGAPLALGSAQAMRAAGLRFIHQELHPVPGLSVAENMMLDHAYPRRFGLVDWARLYRITGDALARLGLSRLDPRAPMSTLGAGDQMLVRIAASLIGDGAWLYVMDEPTAALTTGESDQLFKVIGELLGQGAAVLYVSHRMGEVMRLAHRITVLRDGKHISTLPKAETDEARVIVDMTGRTLDGLFASRAAPLDGPVILRARDLSAPGLTHASFDLRSGEILGLAGVSGSGRGALLRAVLGDGPRKGELMLDGTAVGRKPSAAWAQGIAYVPRERRAEGLVMRRAISENVALPHLTALARGRVFLNAPRQRALARDLGERVRLKSASVSQSCDALSGGNQQKVLFARALAGQPRLLLLDEPTRGVDIGARFDLYRLIRGLSDDGVAIILASSDLPELLGLSDRIGIMRDGILGDIIPAAGLDEAGLLARFYHQQEVTT
ncbi:MAG: sugar ABC transporter ATP-binding protein [Loktanella sp.]|nr:sugar ABC transporter ATP-binding protein [Loktanella sp.]